ERVHPVCDTSVHGLAGEDVHDRLLEGGGDVGDHEPSPGTVGVLHVAGDRGLEPGEGEVVGTVAPLATWKAQRTGVTFLGRTVDVWTSGVGQFQQTGDLVVGLARSVVDGVTERD